MTLQHLTQLILSLNQAPLTHIRLTKAIYFVHKELVRKKLMQLSDISYIRLPLGPTPQGFPEIIAHPDITIEHRPSNLLYETKLYRLQQSTPPADLPSSTVNIVQKLLKLLETYPTLELVRASQDPSWSAHLNGEIYQLTPADLKNTFPLTPFRLKIHIKTSAHLNEIGALQATLLRGMLNDIVKESTDLEYPDEEGTSNPQIPASNDADGIKLHKFILKLPTKLPNWPKKKP